MVTNMGIFELTFSSQAIALKTREAAAIKNFFSLVTKTHHTLEDIRHAKMRCSLKLFSVAQEKQDNKKTAFIAPREIRD